MVDRKFVLHRSANPPTLDQLKAKASDSGRTRTLADTLMWYAHQHRACSKRGGGWFCGGMYQRWLWATAAWTEYMQQIAKKSGWDTMIQRDACLVGERMEKDE